MLPDRPPTAADAIMKTPSLWYVAPERVEIREVELPALGPGDVLVQVDVCGVCTWDLFIFSGGYQEAKPYPFYFGHEGVGHVLEVGDDVKRLREGDRVALRETTEIGRPGHGHMASRAVLSEHMLIPIPDETLPASSWLIEPVACCVNAVDHASVRCGDRVALVGCGFMGGILLEGLLMTPASEVAVFDVKPEHLERARSTRNAGQLTIHDAREIGHGRVDLEGSFDIVIETAAAESGFRLADRLARRRGKLIVFTWHHQPFAIDLGRWHKTGLTVLNVSPSIAYDFDQCFHQSIPLIRSGRIDVGRLVTHRGPADRAQDIYEKGLSKTDGYVKGLIEWS